MPLDNPFCSYTSGSDTTGTGTQLNPYKTVKKGLENLNQDGTLYVRGGTYPDMVSESGGSATSNWNWDFPNGSGGGNYTTLKAYENEPVKFIPFLNTFAMMTWRDLQSYIKIEGIEMQANTNVGFQECFNAQSAYTGDHIWIQAVNCHGFTGQGILTGAYTDGLVLDSIFSAIGTTSLQHGIYLSNGAHRWQVGRTTFHTIAGFGINHYSGSGQADDCRYYNNLIYNYGTAGGHGLLIGNGDDNWAWNNIVRDGHANSSDGIIIDFGAAGHLAQGAKIFHNVVYRTMKNGMSIHEGGDVTAHLIRNNIIVDWNLGGTANRAAIKQIGGTFTKSNNIEDDGSVVPGDIWLDPGSRDFHLKAGASTIIGQGLYDGDFPDDYDGVTRPNPSPDIGPFQYGTAIPPSILVPSPRTTQISVPFSFSAFDVSHGGDLASVLVYIDKGTLS